ncbi:hypothetical protein HMPREF3038_01405 [Akkermansia sp. KLE1797]|nr:hypothetical protein HMPREF3038_01405 [Akkermansia sp. KLE1797]KXU55582.1 hypothetical protein HMPREF3039_00315 [Akkermansia sp. KLE1798]KZA03493.1 hypothetical protein HMPREF1326_02922 [Akkermansia sp. KLE1605]
MKQPLSRPFPSKAAMPGFGGKRRRQGLFNILIDEWVLLKKCV